MVTYGMRPEHARAVHLGIASHNLFDVAYALLLRNHYGVQDAVECEMLEGMANHQARAVQATAGGILLYAPVVKRADFHSAISAWNTIRVRSWVKAMSSATGRFGA